MAAPTAPRPAQLANAVPALLLPLLLLLPAVAATLQLHDADDYDDPVAKAVMECSDMMSPVVGEHAYGGMLFVNFARTCCEDAALAVLEGRRPSSARTAATRCFSRLLFPRGAQPTVDRLTRCLLDVLTDSDPVDGQGQ